MAKFTTKGASGKERYFIDGKQVTQEQFDAAFAAERAALPQVADDPDAEGNRPWTRPILSNALGYHPRQVPAARAHFEKLGLDPQKVQDSGKVALTGMNDRRKVLKRMGMHDNNCFN